MPIIDVHAHLYPPEVAGDPAAWAAGRNEPHWAALCTRRRSDGRPVQGFPTMHQMLQEMDADGVDQAVLLGWYWERPETCVWQNRFYADCLRRHPDRFAAFATFHPAAGAAAVAAEIRRAHADGLIGLGELSPHSQHYRVDNPVFAAALEIAVELKMPVNLHAADPRGKSYPGRVGTPLEEFIGLARAHPRTTFILAHWGGGLPFWETTPAVRRDLAHVFYDTAASPLIYDDRIWRATLDVVPAEKVLLGSDYPLILYPKVEAKPGWGGLIAESAAAGLAAGEQKALLAGNATRLLGL